MFGVHAYKKKYNNSDKNKHINILGIKDIISKNNNNSKNNSN